MVSLLTQSTDVSRAPRHQARRSGIAASPTSRLAAFPGRTGTRWVVRAAFATPFLVLALFPSSAVLASGATPNAQLITRVGTIDWDRADISWVGQIFPPLTTLIAQLMPGGAFGLSILGALLAGIFLQKMMEILVQRRFSRSTAAILMVALAANPLFAYTVLENFAAFAGLAFFGLGISDVMRFVRWGSTRSGFSAGILLMLATLSDYSGLLYVLTAAMAAPFIDLGRHGDKAGVRRANVLVVIFPTLAAVAALVALSWIFTGDPLGHTGPTLFDGTPARFASLAVLFTNVNGWLLIAPILSAWLVALIVRRPGAIAVSTLVFIALMLAFVIGLIPSGSAGNTFILMTLLAISLIPSARSVVSINLVNLVAVAQIAIAWAAAFNRPIVLDWMHNLGSAVLAVFGAK